MSNEDANSHKPSEIASQNFDHYIPLGQGGAITHIDDGVKLPVGGSIFLEDMTGIVLNADISTFHDLYHDVQASVEEFDLEKVEKWLEKSGLISETSYFPPQVFIHLHELTRKLAELYPVNKEGLHAREDLYMKSDRELRLSHIMQEQLAACVEYATLAQGYLQEVSISSTWFSGDLLRSKEKEFAEKHTFIVLHLDQGDFIYDPARPIKSSSGASFPRILSLKVNFLEEMKNSNGRRLVTAYDLFLKSESCYGISRGGNIIPERDIV